jgi:hypothetical protein
MEVTDTQAVQPEPKQAFFVLRATLQQTSIINGVIELKLLTFARRVGPNADDPEPMKAALTKELSTKYPGYVVSNLSAVSVTESTYHTARLMQGAKPAITLAQHVTMDEARNLHAEYKIVPSPLSPNFFRVVAPDGSESALYSKAECEEIVRLAKDGALLGSFGTGAEGSTLPE